MQLNDLLGNGQSKTRAALRARGGALRLLEFFENLLLLGLRNPWPGIRYRYREEGVSQLWIP
jgi:hypothetical protein